MAVNYEWDIETVDPETGDILDHHHFDDCPGIPEESDKRLVLVRDATGRFSGFDRTWAYVKEDGTLPEYFATAYGIHETRVPKRFHAALSNA